MLAGRLQPRIEALVAAPGNWLVARSARSTRRPLIGRMGESRRSFEYRAAMLPHQRLAEVERDTRDLESARETSGLSMGYPAWNLLYYTALCGLRQSEDEVIVVETGTNRGFSTIVLAQALSDGGFRGVVETVDIDPAAVEIARANVAAAGLSDRVRFHVGDSLEFLRGFIARHAAVDFAFLDGSHEDAHVRAEFKILFPRLVTGRGIVYFDNTVAGGVARALSFIRHAYPGNLVEFRNCSWSPPGNAIWQSR